MSRLSAFLNPITTEETKEVIVSKRFVDENGKPVPFVIKALTQEENDKIVRKCRHLRKMPDGRTQEMLDNSELSRNLVVAATVEPDFHDAELCTHYGVVDPTELPGRMLLAGEYAALTAAVMEICRYNDDLEEEAKN